MDFSNESYVRVYTRDTMTWKRLNWQARCVWSLLLRKLDRAGVLDLEGLAPEEAVMLATELPPDVVEQGLPKLLERGVLEARDGALIAPRFLEAQECTKSDTLRSREYRERRRSQTLASPSQNVTPESRGVTGPSREITERHAATETSRDHHSLLCSADPLLPSAVLRSGSARAEDWIVGLNWYCGLLLGGDTTQAPDKELWRGDYAKLGRKSDSERAAVAKFAAGEPWVQENRKALDPGHFVKHWQRYVAGGRKTVDPAPSSREQAEAAKTASVASRVAEARKLFADRINAAKAGGDDYTANRLAAERDQLVAHIQAKAS
jgi:hypothetical protein